MCLCACIWWFQVQVVFVLFSFAHGPEELKISLDLQKTKLCQLWMQGACNNVICRKNMERIISDYEGWNRMIWMIKQKSVPFVFLLFLCESWPLNNNLCVFVCLSVSQTSLMGMLSSRQLRTTTKLHCVDSGSEACRAQQETAAAMRTDTTNCDLERKPHWSKSLWWLLDGLSIWDIKTLFLFPPATVELRETREKPRWLQARQ